MKRRLLWCSAAAAVCLATFGQALAAERPSDPVSPKSRPVAEIRASLQGLFCNSAEQIDEAVSHMQRGLPPRMAVELVNRNAVVCTFVDMLRYVVEHPVIIGEIPGSFPLFKYEGTLVAVAVGSAVRPVVPAVHIFFAIPERLRGAPMAGRV